MYRSIMVPLDGSPLSEQALPLAASIARRADAVVHLTRISVERHAGSCRFQDVQERRRERAYLKAWAERLRGAGCRAVTVALLDACGMDANSLGVMPHARLLAAALHNQALVMGVDMVVMTTHGSGATRIWLGSVADALVRRLPAPILLVRPQHIAPDLAQDRIFKHVLIPLDGSPRAEAVLESAVRVCSLMEAGCTLLQAMDPLLAGHTIPPYTEGLTKQEVEQLQAESRAYLARTAERLRAQLPRVQTHFTVAEPAAAIIEYAHEHAVDLIAMATHGRHLLSRMMLGSVAHQVIRNIDASVLLYRPPPDLWLRPAAKSELGLQGTNGCTAVVF